MIKVNDIVICVKTHTQGFVVKGKEYCVYGVNPCPCGDIGFDVGVPNQNKVIKSVCVCGNQDFSYVTWTSHTLFRKLDEINASIEAEISECLIREFQEK